MGGAWTSALVFSVCSLACAILSDGFLTADALTHYLYAKYALWEPALLVDMWGRPLVTGLFAVPAALGEDGARTVADDCDPLLVYPASKVALARWVRAQGGRAVGLDLSARQLQPSRRIDAAGGARARESGSVRHARRGGPVGAAQRVPLP